ncbi:MAG: 1,4-alpha-glucan branching protein GlgB [Bryobacteraceae bacterium]
MTPNEVEAIVGGYYSDPFRILGPHRVEAGWEVRAYLPQAAGVSVNVAGTLHPMEKTHPQGFYVSRLEHDPGTYRLHAKLWNGAEQEMEDAYRFPPLLTSFDLHLHGEGTFHESFKTMGAHLVTCEEVPGVRFAVWAPNAELVGVVGDFNDWDAHRHPMRLRTGGIWELFIPEIGIGSCYKYSVRSRFLGHHQQKADPYGFQMEVPPKTASVVCDISLYTWEDDKWMQARARKNYLREPMSIYELHLGSWMRGPHNSYLSYRELASTLVEYVKRLGYTHIELMPPMEHPFSGSWGYQVSGYYAPSARFGTPQDFMYFIDCCHQSGIGVIMDWVPAHFPKDAHGLAFFDGTALYEHADPRKGEHRDWGTLVFNYGRNEVRTFLISNALFWLEKYHIDGLRVDAVASMLYLDYSRKPGEWVPNIHGGNENLEAIDFLKRFNELAHQFPGVVTMAEESTSFSGVSRPVYLNGLGFTMKWNMGWMHDMLNYFSQDPVYRKYHHNSITFSMLYAFTENFLLPISHDEVVHGKKSLLSKMPGDVWRKFANVRAFLAYMYAHPGKKLLFMGSEIGQWNEWNHDASVEWELLQFDHHRKLQHLIRELNRVYKSHPAFYGNDFHYSGFEWVDFRDSEDSVISFLRHSADGKSTLLVCCNFTPVPRWNYRVGAPQPGTYREIINTDSEHFGGSNLGNQGSVSTSPIPAHGRNQSVSLTLPPLAVIVFEPQI